MGGAERWEGKKMGGQKDGRGRNMGGHLCGRTGFPLIRDSKDRISNFFCIEAALGVLPDPPILRGDQLSHSRWDNSTSQHLRNSVTSLPPSLCALVVRKGIFNLRRATIGLSQIPEPIGKRWGEQARRASPDPIALGGPRSIHPSQAP